MFGIYSENFENTDNQGESPYGEPLFRKEENLKSENTNNFFGKYIRILENK